MKTLEQLKKDHELNKKQIAKITGGDLIRGLQKDDGSDDLD
ncbi:hypothetical protein [uncultured Kordia sp.]|nr:hypothetical protein [uncultured Kordia sp.]